MRIHLILLASALICSDAITQTHQRFGLQGRRTSFTSRGNIGSAKGELYQGIHESHHNELLATAVGTKNDITRLYVVHQDQNASTRETWDWFIKQGSDTTGPQAGTAGLLGSVTGLMTPASTATVPRAWGQTVTLAATARISIRGRTTTGAPPDPADGSLFIGHNMTPSPNWTMDGHSVHTSFGSAQYPHANSWTEINATAAPKITWNFVGTATVATQPSNFRTFRFYMDSHGVAMQIGCGGAYGTGGLFPLASSSSAPLAITCRVRAGSAASGGASVAVLAPLGLFPVAVPFGSAGRLRINPAAMLLFFGPAASGSGQAIVPIAPFLPTLGSAPGFKLPFQGGVSSNATGLILSNVQWIEPL